MANPRIIYNGKNVDIDQDLRTLSINYPAERLVNMSVGGVVETQVIRVGCAVSATVINLTQSSFGTLKRQMRQVSQWAQSGQAWQFARDRNETVDTLLNGAASSGSTAITVDNTTGVSTGLNYVVREPTQVQVVSVASVDSSTVVSIDETLDFSFADNSKFQSFGFWDVVGGSVRILEQHPQPFWTLSINFNEDIST